MNLYKYIDDPSKLDQRGVKYAQLMDVFLSLQKFLTNLPYNVDDDVGLFYTKKSATEGLLDSDNHAFKIVIAIRNNQLVIHGSHGDIFKYNLPDESDLSSFTTVLERKIKELVLNYSSDSISW